MRRMKQALEFPGGDLGLTIFDLYFQDVCKICSHRQQHDLFDAAFFFLNIFLSKYLRARSARELKYSS